MVEGCGYWWLVCYGLSCIVLCIIVMGVVIMEGFNLIEEMILKEGSREEDCGKYCSHGGYCIKGKGHKGVHNSGYCQWEDEDSLNKEEADEILKGKMK